MIDMAALRSLLILESAGTIAKTAELVGYTPSAVSQQLKRLERDLGAPLTERVGRRVILTPAARLAVGHARDLLDDLERVRAEIGNPHHLRGQVRLAAFATAERGIVAPATAGLVTSAPDIDLHVIERDPPEAAIALARGEVDLAVLHTWLGLPTALPPEISTELVGHDVADVALPRGHPLAARAMLTPADLVGETWAVIHPGSVCHQWLQQMFADTGAAPRVRYWTAEFATQLAYVAAGTAIALVPRLGRGPTPDGVTYVPVIQPTPCRPVLLAWRATRENDPVLAHLRGALREVARDALSPR